MESEKNSLFLQRACDFLMLNKPIVVALLLFTSYTGMVVGLKSLPDLEITFWTMVGGALSAGGAGALNHYIDRDVDQLMKRTERRPLPAGRLHSAEGLLYGLGACLAGLLIMMVLVNPLSAFLSLVGMVYYLLIYSVWLKRLTVLNVVIGGGAGGIPVLVGWAAATGTLDFNAVFLFMVIFLWTPPHFWSFALLHQNEYAHAGIPILPVVRGRKNTYWQIFLYTLSLVILTLLMPLFQVGDWMFGGIALVSGSVFIIITFRLLVDGTHQRAWQVYRYSNLYLALLFLALIVDTL